MLPTQLTQADTKLLGYLSSRLLFTIAEGKCQVRAPGAGRGRYPLWWTKLFDTFEQNTMQIQGSSIL